MGVIRWEDEQHSFLRAGWLQALSRLPTITHSIPNTHTHTGMFSPLNKLLHLITTQRKDIQRTRHTHTHWVKHSKFKIPILGRWSDQSDLWPLMSSDTSLRQWWGNAQHFSNTPNVDLLPPTLSKLLTFILNHRHRLFVFLSVYHITETVVIIENGMLREARSLWIIMKTNLWVIQSYSALGRVKD